MALSREVVHLKLYFFDIGMWIMIFVKISFVFAFSIALAGCNNLTNKSEGASAVEQYDIVKQSGGSAAELCESARKVAAAFLTDGNQSEYQQWNSNADGHCSSAERGAAAVRRVEDSLKASDDAVGDFMSGSSR